MTTTTRIVLGSRIWERGAKRRGGRVVVIDHNEDGEPMLTAKAHRGDVVTCWLSADQVDPDDIEWPDTFALTALMDAVSGAMAKSSAASARHRDLFDLLRRLERITRGEH